ncbi:MAG: hypothetical protein M3036_05565 [Bifidobacteriales bacterium]|nr:hypothetical protein [Bifidobacteriales bacterium]MCT6856121.1 hypothetical protein [Bombella apis]
MMRLLVVVMAGLALFGVARAEERFVRGSDGTFMVDPQRAYEFLHAAYSEKRIADNAYDVLINKRRGPCYDAVIHMFTYYDDGGGNVTKYCYKPDLESDNAVTGEHPAYAPALPAVPPQ